MLRSLLEKLFGSAWIRHRILVRGTVFLIAALFAIYAAETVLSYRTILQVRERQVENLGRLLEQHTFGTFAILDLELRHVLDRMESRDRPVDLHRFLRDRRDSAPHTIGIHLVNAEGTYYGSSLDEVPKINVSDRNYFKYHREHRDGGLFISEPLISRSVNQWVVTLSRRVNDDHGGFAGIVIGSITLDALKDFYSNLQIGRNGSISLWTSDRTVLTRHPLDLKSIGQRVPPPEALDAQLRVGAESATYQTASGIDGIHRLFHYRKIAGLPLAVIVGIATRDVLMGWALHAIGLGLLTLAFSLVSVWLLRRYLKASELVDLQQIQVVQAAKMSSLGIMAAGIAHEINNPLAVIRARTDHIRELASRGGEERKIIEFADKIISTTDRISKIIKGLRSFSRDSSSDRPAWTALPGLIEGTLELCRERFRNNDVDLRVGPLPSVWINCQDAQISQVLLNLLNNAFDAVHGREERWVALNATWADGHCSIDVTDSGPGIPPEIADKIMVPFFTTKEVGKGTGLGLSISRSIVERHGGTLLLDPESRCTRFVIRLPARDRHPDPVETA